MTRVLVLTSRSMNALFWAFGIAISVYLAGTATGLIRMSSSSEHYATFMFAVISMSGFITLHELAERKLHDPAQAGHFFWVRFAIACIATVMAFASSGYVRSLRHPSGNQPAVLQTVRFLRWFGVGHFRAASELVSLGSTTHNHYRVVGGLFLLWLPHSISAADDTAIRPRIRDELSGLGTNDGLFWFLREAADSIWFLVIFAGALFAVGTLRMVIEIGKAGGNRVAAAPHSRRSSAAASWRQSWAQPCPMSYSPAGSPFR